MSTRKNDSEATLSREAILGALDALSAELGKEGVTGELCLFEEGKI